MDRQNSLDLLWVYNENKHPGVIGGCCVDDVARFLKKKKKIRNGSSMGFFPQRCGHVSGVF